MPRPTSARVQRITQNLRERLRSETLTPGRGFFSNRSLAVHFGVSYQTAHRILANLADEGLLSRRRGTPSLVAGEVEALTRVGLVMAPRAFKEGTFGWRLRELLEEGLAAEGISFAHVEPDRVDSIAADQYPVFWNVEPLPSAFLHLKRFCLVLNARPALGLSAGWVDTISVDNFAGGIIAGELLRDHYRLRRPAILGGPGADRRSQERISGFQTVFPKAKSFNAGSWGYRIARKALEDLVATRSDGVFCVNDRLAVRLRQRLGKGRNAPQLIGFDNASAAEENDLTTIGIPWNTLIESAIGVIARRMRGRRDAARDQILRLEPVVREGRSPARNSKATRR